MNMWPSDSDQIGLRLYEVQKMNLCFIFLLLFFLLGFMSLIAHLQLLLRTLSDLRRLKRWICEGFYRPFHKNMENFNP
jgi:hypothetical protein